jgi:aspartate kinase
LNSQSVKNQFVDIRNCLKSDDNYREGNIDYDLSTKFVRETINFADTQLYVTQGFIASTKTSQTTTLGREGSDYSAALLASMLDAQSVTIWKDVAGVMNADPKLYGDGEVKIIPRLSYKEAIELSYCGATIIHPKTIKPLKIKNIPLYVKSFLQPEKDGSVINDYYAKIDMPPIFIHKQNQVLLTLTPRDFSFIAEEKLSVILSLLASYKVKASLIQTSAISFSLCIDYNQQSFSTMVQELQNAYEVLYNTDVELITIRHYTKEVVDKILSEKTIFVEQRSRLTIKFVVPN